MKQGIGLIGLQLLSMAMTLFSVFYIVAKIPAELYAVVAITQVLTVITNVFSNSGIETYALRTILDWKEKGYITKIKGIITTSIIMRMLLGLIIQIPLFAYSYYISNTKFNSEYFQYFIAFGFVSVIAATNDSIVLNLKAFNKYFLSALVRFIPNTLGKIICLTVFIVWGWKSYLISLLIFPVLSIIVSLYFMRKWLTVKHIIKGKSLIKLLKEVKVFTLSSYLNYLMRAIDQFLVSIFLPPAIIGTFSVAKQINTFGFNLISNLLDPLTQKLVGMKSNKDKFIRHIASIYKIRNIIVILFVISLPLAWFAIKYGVNILNLHRYPYIEIYMFAVFVSLGAAVLFKLPVSYITFFYNPKYYLRISIIQGVFAVGTFVLFSLLFHEKYLFYNRLALNILILISSIIIMKRGESEVGIKITALPLQKQSYNNI